MKLHENGKEIVENCGNFGNLEPIWTCLFAGDDNNDSLRNRIKAPANWAGRESCRGWTAAALRTHQLDWCLHSVWQGRTPRNHWPSWSLKERQKSRLRPFSDRFFTKGLHARGKTINVSSQNIPLTNTNKFEKEKRKKCGRASGEVCCDFEYFVVLNHAEWPRKSSGKEIRLSSVWIALMSGVVKWKRLMGMGCDAETYGERFTKRKETVMNTGRCNLPPGAEDSAAVVSGNVQ